MKQNKVLPLTEIIAQKGAKIYAELRQTGQVIGHNDVMIAATAITNNLMLVTNNTAHFGRIDGLSLGNWFE